MSVRSGSSCRQVCTPSFHDRIHSRHLDSAEHDRDARVLEDGVEQAGKLAVAVPDQEPRSAADVLQVHDEVPGVWVPNIRHPQRQGPVLAGTELRRQEDSALPHSLSGPAYRRQTATGPGTWSATCGPRVNKAATRYWGPVQGLSDDYEFPLTPFGQEHAYDALVALFTPQPGKCDRTLIHCDYLASVVHYRVFAETIGANVFTERVKNGTIPLTLKWNGFDDIEEKTFRSAERESLREVRPSSERDLVIGDHVIFWNHRAYDLINEVVGEAWRLENAVLVDRTRGVDTFLGHGSGEQTKSTMLGKLVDRYNDVVRKALAVIARTTSRDAATSAAARVQMAHDFPRIKPVGSGWHVQGDGHGKMFDDPVASITIANPDLIGLRDPEDLSRMNLVKRPKESE